MLGLFIKNIILKNLLTNHLHGINIQTKIIYYFTYKNDMNYMSIFGNESTNGKEKFIMAKQPQNYNRTALVVGGDRLGSTPVKLGEEGVRILHWRGRNTMSKSKQIPANVDMVIIYWDFVNHRLMQSVKRQAKSKGIPVIYNRCRLTS